MQNQLTSFEGYVDLGAGFAFHVSDIDTERLKGRKVELEAAMQELDWQDHWTQSDREWRKGAVLSLWRINRELEKRGLQ